MTKWLIINDSYAAFKPLINLNFVYYIVKNQTNCCEITLNMQDGKYLVLEFENRDERDLAHVKITQFIMDADPIIVIKAKNISGG